MPDELAELQAWYMKQCDDEWEHSFGVKIDTLDNPGWSVDIDLEGTATEGRPFATVKEAYDDDLEWLICSVEGKLFRGRGGPRQLARMLRIFLDWASEASAPSRS